MNIFKTILTYLLITFSSTSTPPSDDSLTPESSISGELRQWHPITLNLSGPQAHEQDTNPNPFLDYRMSVMFTHESGITHAVPGYFAADGQAAKSSAQQGNIWRAHLSPDLPGTWYYRISFSKGYRAAIHPYSGSELLPYDGISGSFIIEPTDKFGSDFRGKGRLEYVRGPYLRFAGTGEYFLKAGADAPETLLAYVDFDDVTTLNQDQGPLKTWEPHIKDWIPGNPTWQNGKGKGLIGSLNYLASKRMNTVSFLPYNVGGDGQNVWPFTDPHDKLHYDCSRLDQWNIIFSHAQSLGLHLHFKLQEQENDDERLSHQHKIPMAVPAALDGGKLGVERKLYYRELVARFGHHLALNWNLGEENTQSHEEIRECAEFLTALDPYAHPIVIHTFPQQQEQVYLGLLGNQSLLTGASLQNHWDVVHERTWRWREASIAAGRPWVVANDEQGPASGGVPADPGYEGFDGEAHEFKTDATRAGRTYNLHDIRKATLWGNLMAGGAGVEYYFGYQVPQNDLRAEDFRSRDKSWDYARIALEFFHEHLPFWRMTNRSDLVGNPDRKGTTYCFANPGEIYAIYLPEGKLEALDLSADSNEYDVFWFNPRTGGELLPGSVTSVSGGTPVNVGNPPDDPEQDWVVLLQ